MRKREWATCARNYCKKTSGRWERVLLLKERQVSREEKNDCALYNINMQNSKLRMEMRSAAGRDLSGRCNRHYGYCSHF